MLFIPPKGHGLANIFIMLTDFFYNYPDGIVHESIRDFEIGRWLTLNFETTDRTDLPTYEAKIYINNFTIEHVHPLIRKLIKPSPELELLINEYSHLCAPLGIHVRRGASSSDSRKIVSRDEDIFASDEAVQKMVQMAKGPTFLASDSPLTKKLFPPHVRTLDTEIAVIHGDVSCNARDRVNVFLDFFLLSACERIVVTGGDFPETPGYFSTFGYMAAIYGDSKFIIVKN